MLGPAAGERVFWWNSRRDPAKQDRTRTGTVVVDTWASACPECDHALGMRRTLMVRWDEHPPAGARPGGHTPIDMETRELCAGDGHDFAWPLDAD